MHTETKQLLYRRLRPLYIAAFLQSFILWYAVEKLFMKSIGFDDAGIGVMVAFYSAIMLLAETPSGILADRWGRKGVLILASISLALSSLIGGLSQTTEIYLLAAGFWGLFFALYSGTTESMIYDSVLEQTGKSDHYEYYYGRAKIVDSVALVLGSLAGGLVASLFDLRLTFFVTLPLVLLSILALLRFQEPSLHKREVAMPITQHILTTFKAVPKRGQLVPIMVVLVAGSTLNYMLFEFDQLWVIALSAPLILYGPINALLLSTIGIGGATASYFKLHRYPIMMLTVSLMVLSSLSLIFSRSLVIIVLSITFLCIGVMALNVIYSHLLHDSLESNVRAGAASAVSTLGRIIIIPLSLVFGYVSKNDDVFHAGWIVVGLMVVIAVYVYKTYGEGKVLPTMTRTREVSSEIHHTEHS